MLTTVVTVSCFRLQAVCALSDYLQLAAHDVDLQRQVILIEELWYV